VQYMMTHFARVNFQSCERDCVGAAATDAVIALHCGYTALRLVRRLRAARAMHPPQPSRSSYHQPWTFGTVALGAILSNGLWSCLGAFYWLQPGGNHGPLFQFLWRASAQCQVSLFYFAYLAGLAFVRVAGLSPFVTRHELLLSRLGLFHSIAFGLVTLSPTACKQHEYVLWGGVNIMLPLVRPPLTPPPLAPSQPLSAPRSPAQPAQPPGSSPPCPFNIAEPHLTRVRVPLFNKLLIVPHS
jgi:hypothetical protein